MSYRWGWWGGGGRGRGQHRRFSQLRGGRSKVTEVLSGAEEIATSVSVLTSTHVCIHT